MNSLRSQLIGWLIILLTVVALLAAVISYFLAQKDASLLLDQQLRLVARSIDEGSQLQSMQQAFARENREEADRDFVIQVWYENEPVRTSRPDFNLPRMRNSGFSNLVAAGGTWRVYTIVYPNRTVQVSQSGSVRSEIATSSALRSLLPIAVLIPLSYLLVAFGVVHILKPVAVVTEAATQRDASSLAPLPLASIPVEILPLVREINALLARLGTALESQRQFISDAAHELRTPLTAMQLQVDNLLQTRSRDDWAYRVKELTSGIQRASHLVNQLLKMARFETQRQSVKVEMNLGELVKTCMADLIPLAEKKCINLGMTRDDPAMVLANADDLKILFHNLLDNAIRYIPEGGKIDVAVILQDGMAAVEIADDGPGIPESLLPRIFDRFFRASGQNTEGSGIGLAIVKAIAERESAEISLFNRRDGSGLIARVSLSSSLVHAVAADPAEPSLA